MKSKKEAATPQKIALPRLGKDEMNLVEHPFALLKKGSVDSVINLEWEKIHPRTGKTVRAAWRVSGDPELGLPGPVEERLYLVLMELSREQDWPETVMFSRTDILERLGITNANKNYIALHDAFLRLKAVQVDAKRSFWNADTQDFDASLMFNILDEVRITDEKPGRRSGDKPLALSSFRWSRVLHRSLLAGNIRSLSIDFALSLELPLAARLFRYLDKHRVADLDKVRHKYEIELHRLCEIHLGMAPAKYASKLKERLLAAHEELKTRGFLAEVVYEPMKSAPGKEKVIYFFTNGPLPTDGATFSFEIAEDRESSTELGLPTSWQETTLPLSPVELIMAFDMDDEEVRGDACDAVFDELLPEEQATIDVWARAQLPAFLQQTLSAPGARLGMSRQRRARVWADHSELVRAHLRRIAQDEVEARSGRTATDEN